MEAATPTYEVFDGKNPVPSPDAPKSGDETKKGRKNRNAYSATKAEAKLQEAQRQTTYPLKKPGRVNFFQVCADPDSRAENVYVIDAGMDGHFLVNAALLSNPEVRLRVKRVSLYTCVNQAGKYFVWPVPLDAPKVALSCHKAIVTAEKKWLRLNWSAFENGYEQEVADPELYPELVGREPVWDPSGAEILDEAFADNSIDDLKDPRLLAILKGLK